MALACGSEDFLSAGSPGAVEELELLGMWQYLLAVDGKSKNDVRALGTMLASASRSGVSNASLSAFVQRFTNETVAELIVSGEVLPAGLCASPRVEEALKTVAHFLTKTCHTGANLSPLCDRVFVAWENRLLCEDFSPDELTELVRLGAVLPTKNFSYDFVSSLVQYHCRVDGDVLEMFATHPQTKVRAAVARSAGRKEKCSRYCYHRNTRKVSLPVLRDMVGDDCVSVVFRLALNTHTPASVHRRARARLEEAFPAWKNRYVSRGWIPDDTLMFP